MMQQPFLNRNRGALPACAILFTLIVVALSACDPLGYDEPPRQYTDPQCVAEQDAPAPLSKAHSAKWMTTGWDWGTPAYCRQYPSAFRCNEADSVAGRLWVRAEVFDEPARSGRTPGVDRVPAEAYFQFNRSRVEASELHHPYGEFWYPGVPDRYPYIMMSFGWVKQGDTNCRPGPHGGECRDATFNRMRAELVGTDSVYTWWRLVEVDSSMVNGDSLYGMKYKSTEIEAFGGGYLPSESPNMFGNGSSFSNAWDWVRARNERPDYADFGYDRLFYLWMEPMIWRWERHDSVLFTPYRNPTFIWGRNDYRLGVHDPVKWQEQQMDPDTSNATNTGIEPC